MPPGLAVGDVAGVIKDYTPEFGLGYLEVSAGDSIRINHVGEPGRDDDGWIYGDRLRDGETDQKASGWLPVDTVLPPIARRAASQPARRIALSQRTSSARRTMTEEVVALHAVIPERGGYIAAAQGERFKVLYRGSATNGDADWMFVARVSQPFDQGWLARSVVADAYRYPDANPIASNAPATVALEASRAQTLEASRRVEPRDDTRSCLLLPLYAVGSVGAPVVPAMPTCVTLKSSEKISMGPARKGAQRNRATLVTFGLDNLDRELVDKCNSHQGGGATILIEEDELKAALARHEAHDVDLVVDARRFPDPEAMQFTQHTGHHYKIIARLAAHRNFPKWLAHLKKRFVHAHEARVAARAAKGDASGVVPTVTVALYCRAGKHRSVAAAIILVHILNAEGWECSAPRHLSERRWSRYCCKGVCRECTDPSDELKNTLEKALAMWRRAQPCTGSSGQV